MFFGGECIGLFGGMFAVGDVDIPGVGGLVLESLYSECFSAGCLGGFASAANVGVSFDSVAKGIIVLIA